MANYRFSNYGEDRLNAIQQMQTGWQIVFLQKVTLRDAEAIDFGVGKEVSDNQLTLYLP